MKKIITSIALIFGSLFTPIHAAETEVNKTVDKTEASRGEEVTYNIEIPLEELLPEVKPTESVASPTVTEGFVTIKDEADEYLKINDETIKVKVGDQAINYYGIEAKEHNFTIKVYLADLVYFSEDESLNITYTAKIHPQASGDINNKVTVSYKDKTIVKDCSIKITDTNAKINKFLKYVGCVIAVFVIIMILVMAYVKK